MPDIDPSPSSLVARTAGRQHQFRLKRPPIDQKGIGQFFTPAPVAQFMARLPRYSSDNFRVLDPGAGAGILCAAVADRVSNLKRARSVEFVAYENDPKVIPLLESTLAECTDHLESCGHECKFEIRTEDFVLELAAKIGDNSLFDEPERGEFDLVIMNPPYLKVAKSSAYAHAMASMVHGQPNLYALFMAIGAAVVKRGGDFVSITPRSFANGPYFRSFRRRFVDSMTLRQLHLFESRRSTFADSGVLQESIVTHAVGGLSDSKIVVSHGAGDSALDPDRGIELDREFVVDDHRGDCIIRVPTSEHERSVIIAVESWPDRFDSIGLRVSTGPIVMFRATDFVRRGHDVGDGIPLLSVQNVRPYETVWPVESGRKTLSFIVEPKSEKLLVPRSNYALIRRFSAKEEAKRLTASAVYADSFDARGLALENHLNYIYHAERPLTQHETDGIVALLNSSILDTYFRTISGNTQVNASELRAMPFPTLKELGEVGRAVAGMTDHDAIEEIVLDILGIHEYSRCTV